ncbi:MAG: hypothetical protein ABIP99_22580 [Ilumatobacteraceae bacterium]
MTSIDFIDERRGLTATVHTSTVPLLDVDFADDQTRPTRLTRAYRRDGSA